jgi:hypothetical protein
MMEFRIADTFTDSLARLTGEEQKAVKTRRSTCRSTRKPWHELPQARQGPGQAILVRAGERRPRLIVHRDEAS